MSSSISSQDFIFCNCGKTAQTHTSWTSEIPGRRFHLCKDSKKGGCNFFEWEDPVMCSIEMATIMVLRHKIVTNKAEIERLKKKKERLLRINKFAWALLFGASLGCFCWSTSN